MKKKIIIFMFLVCGMLFAVDIYAPGYKVDFRIGDLHYLFERSDSFLGFFHLDLLDKDGTRKTVWKPRGHGHNLMSGTGRGLIFHIYASEVWSGQKAFMMTSYDLEKPSMEFAEISKEGVRTWDYFPVFRPDENIERIVFGKEGTLLMLPESDGAVNSNKWGFRVFMNGYAVEPGPAGFLRDYVHTPPGICCLIQLFKVDDDFLSDYRTVGRDEFSKEYGPCLVVLYKYIYSKYIHDKVRGGMPTLEQIDEILAKIISKDELKVSDEELVHIAKVLRPIMTENVLFVDKQYMEQPQDGGIQLGFIPEWKKGMTKEEASAVARQLREHSRWRETSKLRNVIALIHHYSCDELLREPLEIKIVKKRLNLALDIKAVE